MSWNKLKENAESIVAKNGERVSVDEMFKSLLTFLDDIEGGGIDTTNEVEDTIEDDIEEVIVVDKVQAFGIVLEQTIGDLLTGRLEVENAQELRALWDVIKDYEVNTND